MYIYKITNSINNKMYIGQSIRPVEQRFHRHIQDAISGRLDTHLARAIRKYGPNNFTHTIIDNTAKTQQELTLKEQYWIQYYNATVVGYNETDAVYKCGGNTYQNKTELEMDTIKNKIRRTKLGKNNPRHRKVKAINIINKKYYIYGSMCECARKLGFSNHTCISRRCRKLITTPYKNEWLFEYYDN